VQNDSDTIGGEPAQPKGGTAFPRSWWAGWFKRSLRQAAYPLELRFWKRLVVDRKTGCRIWRDSGHRPYGAITISTHRLAWELVNGPIPEGMHVLHRCDEPRCCNPDHLFLGTQAENMADMHRKGRSRNQYTGKSKAPGPPLQPAGGKT
jgi:hypothetical protein